MRKHFKMAPQVSIFTGVIIVVCLVVLFLNVFHNERDVMKQTAINTMKTTLVSQDVILDSYFDSCRNSLRSVANAGEMINYLQNEEDADAFNAAQTYTYTVGNDMGWEGLYLGTNDFRAITHSNPAAVGVNFVDPAIAPDYFKQLDASEDGYLNDGAFESPITGSMILSIRQSVFDSHGNRIGIVGGAPMLTEVADKINSMAPIGFDNCMFATVDTVNGLYITHKLPELVGTPVEDEIILHIIDGTYTDANNTFSFKIDGQENTAVYKMMDNHPYLLIMSDSNSEIFATQKSSQDFLFFAFVIAAAIMIIATFLTVKYTVSPLRVIQLAMHKVGGLDLTKNENVNTLVGGKSEVSEIATAIDNVSHALNDVIKDVHLTSEELNNVVKNVSDETQNLVAIAENNAAVAEELTASIELTSTAIDVCSDKTNDARDYVAHINDKISESLAKTKTLTEAIKKTKAETDKTLEMNTATTAETTNTIIQVVEDLKATNQIREIVDDIKDIASQTNLLSLNASIEAARAGEAGKGFAVVADEIRALSDQSNKAADEISLIVEGCIKATEDASRAFDKVKEYLEEDVSKTLETFAGTITSYNDSVASVEGAITEIADNSQNLNSSVDEIVVELNEIRKSIQDNDDGINSVAESNNEIQSVAEALTDNMIKCRGQAEELLEQVAAFTVD